MAKAAVTFRLNGSEVAAFADGGQNLLDLLRRGIGDLSTKYGCGQGTCGTCTVLIDGAPHLACLTLAESVGGRNVETAAGLADGPDLHPLQRAFMEKLRGTMRILHAGHADGGQGSPRRKPSPLPHRDHRCDFRQSLPLYRL